MIRLAPRPGWRHFRLNTRHGWKKVRRTISSAEALQTQIRRQQATDTYYSVSWWNKPQDVGDKYHLPRLLGSDLAFDVDAPKPVNAASLNWARRATLWLLHAMQQEPDYVLQPSYPAWTGGRGYRLVYTDTALALPPDPSLRLAALQGRRIYLTQRLQQRMRLLPRRKAALVRRCWDKAITLNPLAVIRVLGTTHGTSGMTSDPVTVSQLRDKEWNHVYLWASASPTAMTWPEHPTPQWLGGVPQPQYLALAGPPPDARDPALFVTNEVMGHPGHFVPFFIIPECASSSVPAAKAVHHLPLVRRWRQGPGRRLGPLYVVEAQTDRGRVLSAFCLTVCQRRELLGLYRRLCVPDYAVMASTGRARMRFPTGLVGTESLPVPNRGQSRSHARLLPPHAVPAAQQWTKTLGLRCVAEAPAT